MAGSDDPFRGWIQDWKRGEKTDFLGGGFKYFLIREPTNKKYWQLNYFFIFIPILGEDEPILTIIFFKWVETTN